MKLGYCILYVTDVPATLAFYERAFGVKQKFLHESQTYGELDTGATRLAFALESMAKDNGCAIHPARAAEAAPAMEVAFVTEDVTAAFERAIVAGAAGVSGPKQKPWGQTVAYVRDPNGFLVELCTPIE